ncbi:VCBS repeat-containing protein [Streptacidiphilus sp. ASG 303]|uniref:FG-GAP-like repeat-containing protein n=1 Tax=Streptacidiphilus sp. ASG 303 TaxID=2896847 RepID=UPI001E4A2FF8|nr:FG-GAP-like repeat-containing protein [Streptacidiphilus sp. ASG 303]MCD0484012.1 VCBS repeat-containing protein [Streptacidiphilus sp. ASG 303]
MRKPMSSLLAVVATGALAIGALSLLPESASATGSGLQGDFNGDGYRDLAMGSGGGAGRVTVIYGSAKGLPDGRRVTIHQNSPGVPGSNETGDEFGAALAVGDMDHDGYSDLVVGVPGERIGNGEFPQGDLVVLWGGSGGLTGGTSLPGGLQSGTPEGSAARQVGTGDFNHDGRTDLAFTVNGALRVVLGPITRAGGTGAVSMVSPVAEGTWIGEFTVGDFDGDGRSDVVYNEDAVPEMETDHGAYGLQYLHSTSSGLVADGALPLPNPLYSRMSLAAGDIDHDGRADLAFTTSGGVSVYYGEAGSLGATRKPVTISEATPGVAGDNDAWDSFGAALAFGDVDGDTYADLLVGNPTERLGADASIQNAGTITLLHGSAQGINTARTQTFNQDSTGVPGHAEPGDRFGSRLQLGDFNHDGRADLAATASGENGTGTVWAFPGTANNLTSTGSAYFGPPAGATGFGAPLAD